LRLMDDIMVPRSFSAQNVHPDRPPYASSVVRPSNFSGVQAFEAIQPENPADKATGITDGTFVNTALALNSTASGNEAVGRVTALVLTSNQVLLVTKYQMNGGVVTYRALNGSEGSVDEAQVNWRKTTGMTSAVRSADRPAMVRATN